MLSCRFCTLLAILLVVITDESNCFNFKDFGFGSESGSAEKKAKVMDDIPTEVKKDQSRSLEFGSFISKKKKHHGKGKKHQKPPSPFDVPVGQTAPDQFQYFLRSNNCQANSSVYHMFMIHYKIVTTKPGLTPEQRGDNYLWLRDLAKTVEFDGTEGRCPPIPPVLPCPPAASEETGHLGQSEQFGQLGSQFGQFRGQSGQFMPMGQTFMMPESPNFPGVPRIPQEPMAFPKM